MDGPEGHYAWWMRMKSGKYHLTTFRGGDRNETGQIYPACAPEVWWRNSNRRGWEVILKAAERIPENACHTCTTYAVVWGML